MKPEDRKRIQQKRLSYSTVKEREEGQARARQERKARQIEEARALLLATDTRRQVVDRAHTGEFWTIMFSQASAPFFVRLVKKHYSEDLVDGDAAACVVTCKALQADGIEFLVASLRRRRLLAPVLTREFLEQFDTSYTQAEMVNSLLILAVEPEMFEYATHAGEHLFAESEMARNGSK